VVDSAANAYQGGKAIFIGDIQVGDSISVVTDGKTITEVYLRASSGTGSNMVTGTVLVVDAKAKTVTLLTSGNRLIYIDAAQAGSIISVATGKTITLSALDANDQLRIYGDYKDASNFIAKSIILEVDAKN